MAIENNLLLIRNYDLWSDLSNEEYEELNVESHFIEAQKGDYIYFEAQHHPKIYFLKSGYIRIGLIDDDGNEVIKEILKPGDFFGQITLERQNLNGEFAQAYKADVSLCTFTVEDFQKLLQKKPQLALKYSRRIGFKLRRMENRLVNLLNRDVKSRLLNFLWQLVTPALNGSPAGSICIPNYLTHDDIARLIGSSRQTITTMINELSDQGLLTYSRNEICFPDVNKVQKLASVA